MAIKLPTCVLSDVLTNFSRRQLCSLQQVSRQFNELIDYRMGAVPFHFVDSLYFNHSQWTFLRNSGESVPHEHLEALLQCKWIRFRLVEINSERSRSELVSPQRLSAMGHVWSHRDCNLAIYPGDLDPFEVEFSAN